MQYLSIENASKSYGEKVLVNNLNLSISKGDRIAIIAKNGSGKTTIMRMICGEEGIEGENAKINISKDIRISYLAQEANLDAEARTIDPVFDADLPEIKALQKYETALVFGNEVKGVSQQVVNASDVVIEIPQYGTKHSLNISVSAGVVIWDVFSKLKV